MKQACGKHEVAAPQILMSLLALRGAAPLLRAGQRHASGASETTPFQRFWRWTTQPRPSWKEDKTEAAVAFCVFGVTGSSSVAVVRPLLRETTGLEGSMKDGPWSYRVISLLCVSPVYACVLVTVGAQRRVFFRPRLAAPSFLGTVAGRHLFFANMANKIFGRFVPAALNPLNRLSVVASPPAGAHLVPNMLLRSAAAARPKP